MVLIQVLCLLMKLCCYDDSGVDYAHSDLNVVAEVDLWGYSNGDAANIF